MALGNYSNLVIIQNGSPSPFGHGNGFVCEFTFPVTATQVLVPVGNLSSKDSVEVRPVQAVASSTDFCYDRTGSTFSNAGQGIASIQTLTGANSAGAQILQLRVFRTT